MDIIIWQKLRSGQNRTGQTGSAALDLALEVINPFSIFLYPLKV